jgi:tetratricopeptide (TPR) repeat protein
MTADAATSAETPATAQQHPQSRKGTLPEWEEERWRNANSRKILLARWACRRHLALWVAWWVLTGALGAIYRILVPRWSLIALASLPWLALTLFLVLLAGWFGVRFRYLAWRAAQACGAVVRLVRDWWRGFLLLLASFFLARIGYRLASDTGLWGGNRAEASFKQVGAELLALAILTLAVLLGSALRGRRRIVVQTFEDLTGIPDCPQGLSERLCGELAAIAHLYREINEMTGTRKGTIYSPAIDVRDVGDLLEGAVSTDVSIDAKFIKVPLRLLMTLGRRFLYEGWITGSLHHQNGRLILLASLSSSRTARTWKVASQDLDAEDQGQQLPAVLDKMIQQLAFRIATDLVATGSPKWRAVRFFTEGLQAYREAQRTDIQKFPRLRRAERSLINALGEDQQFALCHYNLGVVYREMGEDPAAEAAFRRALRNNSEPAAACYALAEGHFWAKRYLDALWFTKNSIRRRPNDLMAWHLRAVSLFEHQTRKEDGGTRGSDAWEEILETEKIAVAMAWWDLCAWLARGPARVSTPTASSRDRREETATITLSLANATALWSPKGKDSVNRRRMALAQRIFEQAARLSPDDAVLYNEWGRQLFQNKSKDLECQDLMNVARVLDRVFAGGLHSFSDRVDFWGRLLAVHAGLARSRPDDGHQHIAREAYTYILDYAGLPDVSSLDDLVEPLERIRNELEKVVSSEKASCFNTAVENIRLSEHETIGAYADRLSPLASGLKLEDEDAAAFYHWRLSVIIDTLNDLIEINNPKPLFDYGSEIEAWLADRQRSLDTYPIVDSKAPPLFLRPLSDLLHARQEDWRWAYAQTLANLGKQEDQPCESVHKLLTDAISLLEFERGGHVQQIVEQGLYRRLAHVCLLEAGLAGRQGDAKQRAKLLEDSLTYAEKSVALRPDGDLEHCVLGQILQELGDYERAKQEWHIASFIEPDPEVLSRLGESLWRRAMEMSSRDSRHEALRQAIRFFERARKLYESDPQGQQERIGEVHSWLGSFHREMLQYDDAIFHHKVAGSMGFRPLEARTSLAWTYLEAGLYADAEKIFREVHRTALDELRERKDFVDGRSAGPGEAMPLHEVITRVCLGWGLLYTDRGILLSRAENLVRSAFGYIHWVRSYKRKELLARCRECLGWICLQRQQLEKGTEDDLEKASRHLCKAVHLFARAEAYWLLAQVYWSRYALLPLERKQELKRAREICERARTSDLRGRRLDDIEALLARIAEAEAPEPGPASRPGAARPARSSFSSVAARR